MTAAPTPPQIIAGRYEVRKSLGAGHFGEVFEVLDHHLNHVCALKIINSTPLGTWAEAQILRQVHGEHILPVLNADLASGLPYVVTDLATHGTVADQIVKGVGIPIPLAVRWARQGVARLHDHQLLHCDIKPENLFLNERNDALVGDLGLAQLQDSSGLVFAAGSPTTMAPEVAASFANGVATRCYGARSDVYSLGATLFWILAGVEPLPCSTPAMILSASQPDVWDVAPHVPQGLRDILNTAIARDPLDRYASPSALDSALGGPSLPPRVWSRIVPHSGHEQCFVGDKKGASLVEVCAIPTSKNSVVSISGRRVGTRRAVKKATRNVPRSRLSAGLRSAFRACG